MVWSFIQISCINNDIINLFEDIGWLTKMENLMLNLLKVLILLSASLHFCFRYSSSANLTGFCPQSSYQLEVANSSYNFFVGSIPKCLKFLPRFLSLSLSHTCFPLLCKSSFTWHLLPSSSTSFAGTASKTKIPIPKQCGIYEEFHSCDSV